MASTSDGRDDETGDVEFVLEEDGRVTAHDTETGIASYGESKAEALRMLAEALELHDGDGESVSEDDLRGVRFGSVGAGGRGAARVHAVDGTAAVFGTGDRESASQS